MTNSDAHSDVPAPATFELPLSSPEEHGDQQLEHELRDSLPGAILVGNVRWFCQFRWLVTAILAFVGVAAWVPPLAGAMNLFQAVGNAIYDAVGVWLHELPFTPERVLEALEKKGK